MSRRALLPAVASLALALSGCLTPHVKPTLSKAVVEARTRAAGEKPVGCPSSDVGSISPLEVAFGFDEATVPEVGHTRLAAAAKWLACYPTTEVVILPDADNHGDAAHLDDLAHRRAQAVHDELRSLGAKDPVIRLLARGATDPVTAPHLLINAKGRGW